MKHLEWTEEEQLYPCSFWEKYFPGCRIGVLDIETTGLHRERSRFILGGLYDVKNRTMHQVFAQSRDEEREALSEFLDLTGRMDAVITYNGRHFDMPFLEARRQACGLSCPRALYDLDLFQMVSGHSPIRRLVPNLKQKTLENYMGLWTKRADEISGAESVELYDHYVLSGDPDAERRILLHNSDDVLQLTRLTGILPKCDVHRAMYKMGFIAGSGDGRMIVRRIDLVRDRLRVQGLQAFSPVNYRCYEMDGYPVYGEYSRQSGQFLLELPLLRQSGICAADLRAAGLDEESFAKYPAAGSGFLVLQEKNELHYREINHFVRSFLERMEDAVYGKQRRKST